MYNQFFALRENPFNVNPDPRFLFLNRQTQQALDSLTDGINARKGLLLLTGEVGTGKTTLLNHVLAWLHQQGTPAAFIFNPHLEVSDLFEFALMDFAVKFDASLMDNSRMRLYQWLLESFRAGQTPVLIVDEAQGLADHVLEEIRMLLNMETCSGKLLQIVLAGQPELEDRLQQPALRQVKQRIALRCKTAPLSRDETHQYIQTRLHIAGANGQPIFASQAMDAAHFYSRGIPRVTNLLCEHALVNASVVQIQPVPPHFIAEVARQFQFDDIKPLSSSSSFTSAPDAQRPPTNSAHSRFISALVSLSALPAPAVLKRSDPSVINAPRWSAPPDDVFSPLPEPAASMLHRGNVSGENPSRKHAAANPISLTPPPIPLAALTKTQSHARVLADWTKFFLEVSSNLTAESAIELSQQPATDPLQEPAIELKQRPVPQPAAQLAAADCQVLNPEAPFRPAPKPLAAKSAHQRARIINLAARRLLLIHWATKWSNSLAAAATTTASTITGVPPPAVLLQLPTQLWLSASTWLRQPYDPTQWRLHDVRPSSELLRFSHKKI
jgi:general secretion pathway protein A